MADFKLAGIVSAVGFGLGYLLSGRTSQVMEAVQGEYAITYMESHNDAKNQHKYYLLLTSGRDNYTAYGRLPGYGRDATMKLDKQPSASKMKELAMKKMKTYQLVGHKYDQIPSEIRAKLENEIGMKSSSPSAEPKQEEKDPYAGMNARQRIFMERRQRKSAESFEANSDEDNCPVCNEEVYGDMSMIGEEIVPDICGDCDIYVMPQGSDFKVRCIECGYGDFYGSRTPCESCEPIADKMEAVNNGKSAENEDGERRFFEFKEDGEIEYLVFGKGRAANRKTHIMTFSKHYGNEPFSMYDKNMGTPKGLGICGVTNRAGIHTFQWDETLTPDAVNCIPCSKYVQSLRDKNWLFTEEKKAETFEADMSVGNEMLRQLGGRRFMMMVGAKQPIWNGDENELGMKIGRNAIGANYFVIRLNPRDLYDLRFESRRMNRKTYEMSVKVKAEHNDVYADQLQEIFENTTGLYTRMAESFDAEYQPDQEIG